MTYKEALDTLQYEVDEEGHCGYIEEEIHKAIEALEKQIPKKPNDIGIIGVSIKVGACPLCSEGCNYAMAYCDRCGQALDWSEEE